MAATTEKATGSPLDAIEPGIKLTAQLRPEPEESDLRWLAQMGIEPRGDVDGRLKSSAEYYASRKALCAEHGITVYGFGNSDVHNQDAIVLGLENRDAKVEEYKRHLQSLGAGGDPLHHLRPHGQRDLVNARGRPRAGEPARGGWTWRARGQGALAAQGVPPPPDQRAGVPERGDVGQLRRTSSAGRRRWRRRTGVMIGIHPDDPPGCPRMGGVPRLFRTFDRYERALDIADSPNVGVCLCPAAGWRGAT